MKALELTLPEFAFIDGSEHEGNILQGRTVFQHIRSYTIFELFDQDDLQIIKPEIVTYKFQYINLFGVIENLLLVVHFTIAESQNINSILEEASQWYMDYCRWEDRNIEQGGDLHE